MSEKPHDLPALEDTVLEAIVHHLQDAAPGQDLPTPKTSAPDRDDHGDLSIPCHPYARFLRKAPQAIASDLAAVLVELPSVARAEPLNGFLNVHFDPETWFAASLGSILGDPQGYGRAAAPSGRRVMVEFSSPNTNKPQHLGHIRNNLLGATVCNLLEACGDEVIRANLVNDRGIHICKSMLAYQRHGQEETPESTGIKGDLLVGNYYVRFDKEVGASGDEGAELLEAAQDLLRQWEAGDEEVVALWKRMNGWVMDGFWATYDRLGIRFDKIYKESETYKLGKQTVLEALETGVCVQEEDGSVWIDLTDDDLDRKILLRKDGTSVYMTQDIGTAQLKESDYGLDRSIYVVGSEQDYHFRVLFLTLQKMGFEWARGCHHLSYGMVFLPEGKMKSREGTVVDADDLMESVVGSVRDRMLERDEELKLAARDCAAAVAEHSTQALEEMTSISESVGMGALKFYMLKYGARKDFTFNPEESISLQGDTGPYVQFAYTRIVGILRKAGLDETALAAAPLAAADLAALGNPEERALARLLGGFPKEVRLAAENLNPAAICTYLLQVAQAFHRFVHDHQVLRAENEGLISARLCLCIATATVLSSGLAMLGIEAPSRM